jgi:hypothetical protein
VRRERSADGEEECEKAGKESEFHRCESYFLGGYGVFSCNVRGS